MIQVVDSVHRADWSDRDASVARSLGGERCSLSSISGAD